MPAAVLTCPNAKEAPMSAVMIGIDPHKGSHTAVALDGVEAKLGEIRVSSSVTQVERLLEWAKGWSERTWAIEGAKGLGRLLAEQLVTAGERVVDVQPKLAARVRLLNTGAVNKNDPNDARSVAVAALRSPSLKEIGPESHAAVMKIWARRHRDLSRTRNRIACRLHAVLCELVPGGFAKEISAVQAARVLENIEAHGASAVARMELAGELLEDLRRIDDQLRDAKRRLAKIVKESKTTLTEIYGVGPIVAATVIGDVAEISRFSSKDRFAAYNGTAPIEASSGNNKVHRLSRRGNRRMNHAIHMAAVTQISHRGTVGRAYYDRKISEGMAHKSALRALKRRISDALYGRMIADARSAAAAIEEGPGGQLGNDSISSVAGSHPQTPTLRSGHSRARSNPRSLRSAANIGNPPRRAKATRRAS
jgi:transposase